MVVGILLSLLVLIIVPLSFSYLEYDEIGLVKGRVNGKVSIDKVYLGGRHLLGPSYVFQKYPASAHIISQKGVSVVSSDKLETDIDLTIVYFIDPNQLGSLQQEFNRRYETVVQSRALSAVKNAAVQFSTLQFFQNRKRVRDTLHEAVRVELETNLFVKVPFLFMGALSIPSVVSTKQLQTAVQNQVNIQQLYDNQASLVRKDTNTQANALQNNATIIVQQALAQASSMMLQANATAFQTVETARSVALGNLYSCINVTDASTMTALDHEFTLLHSNLQLRLGYDSVIKLG